MSYQPRVVDLYAGVGGFSLGFHQAGFNVELAIDIDGVSLETYGRNFPNCRTAELDLGETAPDEIQSLVGLEAGELDVVIGGPPCQGFSIMGKGEDDDSRNDLLLRFGEHAVGLSPKYIVLENVKGLLTERARSYIDSYIDILDSAGYECLEPIQTLNAQEFGVPQSRERVFIIAYREGEKPPSYPIPTNQETTVSDAISDIPSFLDTISIKDGWLTDARGSTSPYVSNLNSWDSQGEFHGNGLSGMTPVDHTDRVRERFSEVEPGDVDGPSQFVRLKKGGVSPTLRAGSSSERGNHTAARPIHPEAPRVITVREAARLQSFPDWYQFHPTKYHGMRQIGNSVPPLLAKYVAEEIIAILE